MWPILQFRMIYWTWIKYEKKTQYISWLMTLWKHNEGITIIFINFVHKCSYFCNTFIPICIGPLVNYYDVENDFKL
jgi:hypothetical protein